MLACLLAETRAGLICAEEGYSPHARCRDAEIAAVLPLRLMPGRTVFQPTAVTTSDGNPYRVFTPFMRRWRSLLLPSARDLLPASNRLPAVPAGLLSAEIPEANPVADSPPGEEEALRRLQVFADGAHAAVCRYCNGRERLDQSGTSALSPYLRFGMISARQAVVAARDSTCSTGDGPETWLNELIWREFYQAVLFHFPNVLKEAFRADLRDIPWQNNPGDFTAWCDGRTGYPVVDAAMRQLVQTGWMHNRARMIVASFLVKDLLIDWRWGERFFMEHLIDGDAAANNGGWQWTAGVGADAAPYFRIFNPILQARKFDPDGIYVRRWLPELAHVPTTSIHEPWTMATDVQRSAGCVIGHDYPAPIIDRQMARQRTLAAYRSAQGRL